MDPNWAVQHLQVIRTLMERSSIYRRTLAPVMLMLGCVGIIGAGIGWWNGWDSTRAFAFYWAVIGALGLCASFGLLRWQAFKVNEPFWSPPTRRVTQAILPPFFAGWIMVIAAFLPRWQDVIHSWWFPPLWMILYGCGLHAAGFFMPRGMKLFGWMFILAGAALFCGLSIESNLPPLRWGHAIMGAVFGGFHLAYGIYLYMTEKGRQIE